LQKDGLTMLDIHSLIKALGHKYSPEMLSEILSSLVKKGLMEQYVDEDGEFTFKLTDFGHKSAEDMLSNPVQFFDLDLDIDFDEEDGMV